MLDKTANYVECHNIQFSTNVNITKSKTKCMMFGKDKNWVIPEKLVLNGKHLPWVETAKYLGSMISNKKDILETDISMKRGKFIENANTLLQEFKWAHLAIMARIIMIYNSNIYGSNLFPLNSNSYSVATRVVWNLPRETHVYIL